MSLTSSFNYKCRSCGKLFTTTSTSPINALSILVSVLSGGDPNNWIDIGRAPRMCEIHSCNDECVGVGDLIGFVTENNLP